MDFDSLAALYLRRPSLEYCQALDRLVQGNHAANIPSLAVLSSVVHAVELLKRCQGLLHLTGTGAFNAGHFVAQARGWNWGPIAAVDLANIGPIYPSIMWAEPELSSAQTIAFQLRNLASAGVDLRVITTGPLRRFLPAWQTCPRPADHPLNPRAVFHLLRKTGWQVQEQITFHGPRSVAWTFLARLANRIGQLDWADRCTLMMRACYQEPGWLWPAAPLVLIRARAI